MPHPTVALLARKQIERESIVWRAKVSLQSDLEINKITLDSVHGEERGNMSFAPILLQAGIEPRTKVWSERYLQHGLERFQDRYTVSGVVQGRRSLGSRQLDCITFEVRQSWNRSSPRLTFPVNPLS